MCVCVCEGDSVGSSMLLYVAEQQQGAHRVRGINISAPFAYPQYATDAALSRPAGLAIDSVLFQLYIHYVIPVTQLCFVEY